MKCSFFEERQVADNRFGIQKTKQLQFQMTESGVVKKQPSRTQCLEQLLQHR